MTAYLPLRAVLRNGESVLIREIVPGDRPLMRDGFEKLSAQSRFFRFLAPHRQLSEAELTQFTEENTDEHFALGALSVGVDHDMPLGTARFVRLSEGSDEAEFALTIIDSHQRLGLGSLLLRTLARIAANRGIKRFSALLHHENFGMKRLLERFEGYRISQGTEEEWVLPLPLKSDQAASRSPSEIAIWRGKP